MSRVDRGARFASHIEAKFGRNGKVKLPASTKQIATDGNVSKKLGIPDEDARHEYIS